NIREATDPGFLYGMTSPSRTRADVMTRIQLHILAVQSGLCAVDIHSIDQGNIPEHHQFVCTLSGQNEMQQVILTEGFNTDMAGVGHISPVSVYPEGAIVDAKYGSDTVVILQIKHTHVKVVYAVAPSA